MNDLIRNNKQVEHYILRFSPAKNYESGDMTFGKQHKFLTSYLDGLEINLIHCFERKKKV